MQKIFNGLAVASFVMSSSIFVTGLYAYSQKDEIFKWMQEQVFVQMGEAIGGEIGRTLLGGNAPDDPVEGMLEDGAVPINILPFGG